MGVQERVYKVGTYYNLTPREWVFIQTRALLQLYPQRVGVQERVINKGPIITLPLESGCSREDYKQGTYYNFTPMRVGVHINKGIITPLPPESGCPREGYKQGTYYNFTPREWVFI